MRYNPRWGNILCHYHKSLSSLTQGCSFNTLYNQRLMCISQSAALISLRRLAERKDKKRGLLQRGGDVKRLRYGITTTIPRVCPAVVVVMVWHLTCTVSCSACVVHCVVLHGSGHIDQLLGYKKAPSPLLHHINSPLPFQAQVEEESSPP